MLGSVADDFTGATDLAGNWRSRGLKTAVLLGIPPENLRDRLTEYDALVAANKIRSIPADEARRIAREAGELLLSLGCTQIYDKYCSTFDSTPEGNIGPIADELADLTGATRAVVVPSFPDAGRTVFQAHHFVFDQLLAESPMKDHPLNPMWDSSVIRLLQAQTDRPVGGINLNVVREGAQALRKVLDEQTGEYFYFVIDATNNADLAVIAEATMDDTLVTGGSGIALGLPMRDAQLSQVPAVPGRRLVLSGSASAMTQQQVTHAQASLPYRQLDVLSLAGNVDDVVSEYANWVRAQWEADPEAIPMIFTVANRDDVAATKGQPKDTARLIESFFGSVARNVSGDGLGQIIIAGGETSGAVCEALEIRILDLGEQLAPGVSWLLGTSADAQYNLVLKSGNFGAEDLFTAAWKELE